MTTTLDLHPWNFMPMEILEHIFSFLPARDRHNVSCMCMLWATAVSFASVWSFTEVHCDSDENKEEMDGGTSRGFQQKIQPYMADIRYLKLVLDVSLELNRRLACAILDEMARKSRRLQGLQIVCYGKSPLSYSGQDILQSLGHLFQSMDKATIQHVDLRQMPFVLDNGTISLVASCSPNLRTLLINNHALTMLRRETIVEVLRSCPKLSTLGISYFSLSPGVFQELLKPNREPFKYLELFYDGLDIDVPYGCLVLGLPGAVELNQGPLNYLELFYYGLDNDIPAYCWTLARERHPSFRVGLEFAESVTMPTIAQVLKPYLPISQVRFNAFTHIDNQVMLVANLYAATLEKLVLYSRPSIDLNIALIQVARTCAQLKEIHCFCVVGLGVVAAFRHHHPHLKRYTLSYTPFSLDNPPTVVQ